MLAQKYKKFNYDLLCFGEKITVFKLKMSRENVLEDSYCFLTKLKTKFSRTQFLIKFSEEEGVDYGGVGKEWFHLLSSEIFKEDYGLFVINKQNNQLDINMCSIDIVPVN
jgi:E3 ubiquitin-protein ligase NEDD4